MKTIEDSDCFMCEYDGCCEQAIRCADEYPNYKRVKARNPMMKPGMRICKRCWEHLTKVSAR